MLASLSNGSRWRWRRWVMVPWVLVGLFVGIGGASFGQLWWESLSPNPIVIYHVDVTPLDDGGYKLAVHMLAPRTATCLRIAEHVISPEPNSENEAEFQPLAGALAGGSFTKGGDITVDLKVHPGMVRQGSVWYYTYRAAYECTRFPGLLRVSGAQSRPIQIIFSNS